MSEFVKIAANGQWELVKNDGTGVVQAPKDLARVSDISVPKPAMPKITPQPAEKVGLANTANRTTVHAPGESTFVKPPTGNVDPTVVRPQTGTRLYAMSPQSSTAPVNQAPTRITNMSFGEQGLPMGYHPDPFNAALRESQAHERSKAVAPSIPSVAKGEPGSTELHDHKGRCLNCGDKGCSGTACQEEAQDTSAAAVTNVKTNTEGFKNKIKGIEKLKLNKSGQWSLGNF
jgi:hypothetical protein